MRVRIEEIGQNQEEELVLRCHQPSDGLLERLRRFQREALELTGVRDKEIHRLRLDEVYYFEVVEGRAFLYSRDQVYESALKLYEFEEASGGTRFFRASKSMVVNADKIDFITPSLSGRFVATLLNGEKVVVSRQYVAVLKKKMGL